MFGKHAEIDHKKKLVGGNKYINIRGFWSFAKEYSYKYHGICRNGDIFKKLVQIVLGGNFVPK